MQEAPAIQPGPSGRAFSLAALVLSGEAIFLLPFVLARVFRPTLLDVFDLTNLDLGTAFSAYGLVAMVAYFGGGPLADRFSARKLLVVALLSTAAGGIVLAQVPSIATLRWLFFFWGISTILPFWAALIRATREWGGERSQGRAYGLLDGGRGLVAALLASVSLILFSAILPADAAAATLEQKRLALVQVIWLFTAFTAATSAVVWFWVPDSSAGSDSGGRLSLRGVSAVVRLPAVWLQACIILCAYVGYKATDDFSLFARDVFDYDDVASAGVGTLAFWLRPVAAVCAGWLGDRFRRLPMIVGSFALLLLMALVIAFGPLGPGVGWMLAFTVAGTCTAVYALRGLYFAVFGEGRVPIAFTGSAVGLVSVVGYTPDIFMGPLMGYLLDSAPGEPGHRHLFAAVAIFAAIGLAAAIEFNRRASNSRNA